jgi:glutathione synthase/RimK-type ligase-like ATP-grasp enzyme
MKIDDAPAEVVRLAVRGSSAIGNGLYGVDIKQTHDRTVLIEVNDNPSIDASVEDAELGEELYQRIMRELLRRMEAKRNGVAA